MVDLNEIIDTPNISEEERQDMLKKSMYSLPDNPHKNGYNANEIKKRGWQYALGLDNSLFSKINEINESHNNKEQLLKDKFLQDCVTKDWINLNFYTKQQTNNLVAEDVQHSAITNTEIDNLFNN